MQARFDKAFLIPVAAGFFFVAHATRNGVGASPDSAHYIAAARSLANGRGLFVSFGLPMPEPLSWWPPSYSIVLAGIEKLSGVDPLVSTRWLNAVLFAGLVAMIGRFTHRAGRASPGWCAASLIAVATPLITVYSMAWSDGLFLFLGVAGLALCAAGMAQNNTWHFHAAGVVLGLCWFTRFAGLAFIIAAALMIVFSWLAQSRRTRSGVVVQWQHVLAVILWPIPLMIWLRMRNASLNVPRLDNEIHWWPIGDQLIAPEVGAAIPGGISVIAGVALLGAVVISWITFRAAHRIWTRPPDESRSDDVILLLGLAWWSYTLLLLASSFLLGRGYPFDGRILSPLYVLAIPVIVLAVEEKLLYARKGELGLRIVAKLVLVLYLVAGRHSHKFAEAHVGMGTNDWRNSPAIAALRALPRDTIIYSNSADAIYLFANRDAIWLPYQMPGEFTRGSIAWSDPDKCRRQFEADLSKGAIVAFFARPSHGLQTMKREEFIAASGARVTKELSDGFLATGRRTD